MSQAVEAIRNNASLLANKDDILAFLLKQH
jgi:hypothetical protein